MPDISSSSETNLRPRVSFNRDVHVKRIGGRGATTAPGPSEIDSNRPRSRNRIDSNTLPSPKRSPLVKGTKLKRSVSDASNTMRPIVRIINIEREQDPVVYAKVVPPKYRPNNEDSDEGLGVDYDNRGRADGTDEVAASRGDLSTRRDLLESRIHWWGDKLAANRRLQQQQQYRPRHPTPPRDYHVKSTPNIYQNYVEDDEKKSFFYYPSSARLLREYSTPPKYQQRCADSEDDEGFASTFQIANNRNGCDKKYHVPRERCIDDGTYYDPHIDKPVSVEAKPPKPDKKNGFDKVRKLFGREQKTKNQDESKPVNNYYPNLPRRTNKKPPLLVPTAWFKSLDRFTLRKKPKKEPVSNKGTVTKTLRFFGDTTTDGDSSDTTATNSPRRLKSALKTQSKSQSSRDLHVISEEQIPIQRNGVLRKRNTHKSMGNLARDGSSTEGDSSQHSQRSVVWLHAATVGDIPSPAPVRREFGPQTRAVSRSVSVLAPWAPPARKPQRRNQRTQTHSGRNNNNNNSQSVESLKWVWDGEDHRKRSHSMPRNPSKSSDGWYRKY